MGHYERIKIAKVVSSSRAKMEIHYQRWVLTLWQEADLLKDPLPEDVCTIEDHFNEMYVSLAKFQLAEWTNDIFSMQNPDPIYARAIHLFLIHPVPFQMQIIWSKRSYTMNKKTGIYILAMKL